MLSTAYGFLYLHIPKTGGNSVQDALRVHSDDRLVCLAPHHDGRERFELRSDRYRTHKHSTLADYAREYGPVVFESLNRFTCARNPWDRVVSFYRSPHRGHVHWSREDFLRFVPTVQPMRHYLGLPGDAAPSLEIAVKNVHRILRFESLQADFDDICERFGIPTATLPHRNRSDRLGYREYYDAESRDLVGSLFGDEARLFGYTF